MNWLSCTELRVLVCVCVCVCVCVYAWLFECMTHWAAGLVREARRRRMGRRRGRRRRGRRRRGRRRRGRRRRGRRRRGRRRRGRRRRGRRRAGRRRLGGGGEGGGGEGGGGEGGGGEGGGGLGGGGEGGGGLGGGGLGGGGEGGGGEGGGGLGGGGEGGGGEGEGGGGEGECSGGEGGVFGGEGGGGEGEGEGGIVGGRGEGGGGEGSGGRWWQRHTGRRCRGWRAVLNDCGHGLDGLDGNAQRHRRDAHIRKRRGEARHEHLRLGRYCGDRGGQLHAWREQGLCKPSVACSRHSGRTRVRCHNAHPINCDLGDGRHTRSVRGGVVGVGVSLHDRAEDHKLLTRCGCASARVVARKCRRGARAHHHQSASGDE